MFTFLPAKLSRIFLCTLQIHTVNVEIWVQQVAVCTAQKVVHSVIVNLSYVFSTP